MWRKDCLKQTLNDSFARCINAKMFALASIENFQFMLACDPPVETLPILIYFNTIFGPSEKHF